MFAKFDQFLPVRSHFDTKRPVNLFHAATFQSATFGRPLFAFVLCVLRQKIIKRTEDARKVMLNKSVLNYYSHFSSLFPDFFIAIVFYSSRRIVSDKKKNLGHSYSTLPQM